MKLEKKVLRNILLLSTIYLTSSITGIYAESAFILRLPNDKQVEKVSVSKKGEKKAKKQKRKKTSTYLPLPVSIEHTSPKVQNKSKKATTKNQPILPLSIKPSQKVAGKEKSKVVNQDDLKIPDEVVITPDDSSANDILIEPNIDTGFTNNNSLENTDVTADTQQTDGTLPVFPKDTSSAIFMIMKTWQCQDFDGNALLQKATEVYGKEAEDSFQIEGLTNEHPFNIDLDEEDITLDELLDIIAHKTNRDWGVDMRSKIIYFYPPKQQ